MENKATEKKQKYITKTLTFNQYDKLQELNKKLGQNEDMSENERLSKVMHWLLDEIYPEIKKDVITMPELNRLYLETLSGLSKVEGEAIKN